MNRITRNKLVWMAAYLALMACSAIMAVPETARGGKPNGNGRGGGGEDAALLPCILFDDMDGDSIGSDAFDGSSPYCDDKSAKVSVGFGDKGHMWFISSDTNKVGAGRSLSIDFGEPITILDGRGQPQTFASTDDLNDWEVPHDVGMQVGVMQDDFDMFAMAPGETRHDVNVNFYFYIHFHNPETAIRIVFIPEPLDNGFGRPGSDPVAVKYLGIVDGLRAWRVFPADGDNDLDGLTVRTNSTALIMTRTAWSMKTRLEAVWRV